MNAASRKTAVIITLIGIITVVFYDAYRFHLDKHMVQLKKQHQSSQRHWNLFYSQENVFYQSMFRYVGDLVEIKKLVKPQSAVISDLPTSYYLSATLPVYVRNIHRHQGRYKISTVGEMFDNRDLCRTNLEDYVIRTTKLLKHDKEQSRKHNWPILKYLLLNKDKRNTVTKTLCYNSNGAAIAEEFSKFSNLLYQGDYLDLYELK